MSGLLTQTTRTRAAKSKADKHPAWKLLAVFTLGGVCLGWQAAASRTAQVYAASSSVPTKTQILAFPRAAATVTVVQVPAALSAEQQQALEIAKLKTRQRRLEALVRVLRERQTAVH